MVLIQYSAQLLQRAVGLVALQKHRPVHQGKMVVLAAVRTTINKLRTEQVHQDRATMGALLLVRQIILVAVVAGLQRLAVIQHQPMPGMGVMELLLQFLEVLSLMLVVVVDLLTPAQERQAPVVLVAAVMAIKQALVLMERLIREAAAVVVVANLIMTVVMAAPASLLFGMPILMMTLYPPQDPQPSQIPAAIKSTNGPDPVRSHSKRHQWHTLHS
jgi:hypothetical protein